MYYIIYIISYVYVYIYIYIYIYIMYRVAAWMDSSSERWTRWFTSGRKEVATRVPVADSDHSDEFMIQWCSSRDFVVGRSNAWVRTAPERQWLLLLACLRTRLRFEQDEPQ